MMLAHIFDERSDKTNIYTFYLASSKDIFFLPHFKWRIVQKRNDRFYELYTCYYHNYFIALLSRSWLINVWMNFKETVNNSSPSQRWWYCSVWASPSHGPRMMFRVCDLHVADCISKFVESRDFICQPVYGSPYTTASQCHWNCWTCGRID